MDYEQRAEALFREGYNCAQAVFLAFALEKLGRDEAARLASAFGGGMAGMRNTCGAVSGMAMAYGLLRGYSDPKAKTEKRAEYEAVRDMAEQFAQENGSIICRELLQLGKDAGYQPPAERTEQYYKKRPCAQLCACAAGFLAHYLNSHPDGTARPETKSPTFGAET